MGVVADTCCDTLLVIQAQKVPAISAGRLYLPAVRRQVPRLNCAILNIDPASQPLGTFKQAAVPWRIGFRLTKGRRAPKRREENKSSTCRMSLAHQSHEFSPPYCQSARRRVLSIRRSHCFANESSLLPEDPLGG